jgi:hypothetical protein
MQDVTFAISYVVRMSRDDDDLEESADYSDAGADAELEALTADIGTILAGRTAVPAAIMWWRTRHERRAEKEAPSASAAEPSRRPRWFEI